MYKNDGQGDPEFGYAQDPHAYSSSGEDTPSSSPPTTPPSSPPATTPPRRHNELEHIRVSQLAAFSRLDRTLETVGEEYEQAHTDEKAHLLLKESASKQLGYCKVEFEKHQRAQQDAFDRYDNISVLKQNPKHDLRRDIEDSIQKKLDAEKNVQRYSKELEECSKAAADARKECADARDQVMRITQTIRRQLSAMEYSVTTPPADATCEGRVDMVRNDLASLRAKLIDGEKATVIEDAVDHANVAGTVYGDM